MHFSSFPPSRLLRSVLLVLLGVSLLCFYLLVARRYLFLGYFSDDANYVLGALSLTQGHYVILWHPEQIPMDLFWPGYPLFLAPFVAWLAPHWEGLTVVSCALALSAAFFWHQTLRQTQTKTLSTLFVLLLLLNPLYAMQSGFVMSDIFLTFMGAAIFWLLAQWERAPQGKLLVLLIVTAAWAGLVRVPGLLLPLAVLCAFLIKKHFRAALYFALGCGVLITALLGCYIKNAGTLSSYWPAFLGQFSDGPSLVPAFGAQTYQFFVCTFGALLGLSVPPSLIPLSFTVLAVLVAIGALYGFNVWRGLEGRNKNMVVIAILVYCALHFLMHSLWTGYTIRYIVPLIAPLTAAFLIGSSALLRKSHYPKMVGVVGLGVWFACFIFQNARLSAGIVSSQRMGEQLFPAQTLDWIRQHTPPTARFQNASAMIYLYTGRLGSGDIFATTAEEYRYELLRQKISHVYFSPRSVLAVKSRGRSNHELNHQRKNEFLLSTPSAFSLMYSNEREQTAIYQVIANGQFEKGYALYRAAMLELHEGNTKEGLKGLDAALALDPQIPSALNAYGAACLLSDQNLDVAEKRLRQAVALKPPYALAWMNLGRLYEKRGQLKKAQEAYGEAKRWGAQF